MNNHTIINRNLNIRPNSVMRVYEEKTKLADIDKKTSDQFIEMFSLLHERLNTISDMIDFKRKIITVQNIIRERNQELIRIKRMENMKNNTGFVLTSIIIIFGIIGLSLITFLVTKSIIN